MVGRFGIISLVTDEYPLQKYRTGRSKDVNGVPRALLCPECRNCCDFLAEYDLAGLHVMFLLLIVDRKLSQPFLSYHHLFILGPAKPTHFQLRSFLHPIQILKVRKSSHFRGDIALMLNAKCGFHLNIPRWKLTPGTLPSVLGGHLL